MSPRLNKRFLVRKLVHDSRFYTALIEMLSEKGFLNTRQGIKRGYKVQII